MDVGQVSVEKTSFLTRCIETLAVQAGIPLVIFLAIKGAYDNVGRELLWHILKQGDILGKFV